MVEHEQNLTEPRPQPTRPRVRVVHLAFGLLFVLVGIDAMVDDDGGTGIRSDIELQITD